jgi:hypothetical protein
MDRTRVAHWRLDDGASVSPRERRSDPAQPVARITGRRVVPLAPTSGDVLVFVVGEAPGPRGADKSGYPFFGDAAGEHLYRLLADMGAATMPAAVATLPWDGSVFNMHALVPQLHGLALGNAFDRCPTDDGVRFRAPTRVELEGDENVERIRGELRALMRRGLRGVVTLGRVASRTLDRVMASDEFASLVHRSVPHPSAQGLLSMAPDRGRGARMDELKGQWMQRCRDAIIDAGWRSELSET